METLKKFIALPLKHKVVSIIMLIVITLATIFGTSACSFKAKDLEFNAQSPVNTTTKESNTND